MRTLLKIAVAGLLVILVGFVAVVATITYVHAKSRREVIQLLSEIQPGMSFARVSSRLGHESETLTNAADIRKWGTTMDDRVTTNSTLHMFAHDKIPFRWICVYTDRQSQTVIYASWRDM